MQNGFVLPACDRHYNWRMILYLKRWLKEMRLWCTVNQNRRLGFFLQGCEHYLYVKWPIFIIYDEKGSNEVAV
jgi:hypothetical protein